MFLETICILECLLTQNPTNQGSKNSLDSSRSYERLLENPKAGASKVLFLPENDFKTSSTVNFQKKCSDFGDLETNQTHEPQAKLFFICPSTYQLNII